MKPSVTEQTEAMPAGSRRDERPRRPLLDMVASTSWKFLASAAALAVIVYALVKLRVVVFPVIAALFAATLIHPAAQWLHRRGLPRLAAVWAAILGGLLLLGGIIALLAPQVANEFGTLSGDVTRGSRQVIEWLSRGPLELSRTELNRYIDSRHRAITGELEHDHLGRPRRSDQARRGPRGHRSHLRADVLLRQGRRRHVLVVQRPVLGTAAAERQRSRDEAVGDARRLPQRPRSRGARRRRAHRYRAPLNRSAARHTSGRVLTLFGAFLPLIGATVARVVAALVALVSGGVVDVLLVGVAILAIQQVEGHVLQPVVLGRAIKLHPTVVLLSLAAGGVLAGSPAPSWRCPSRHSPPSSEATSRPNAGPSFRPTEDRTTIEAAA